MGDVTHQMDRSELISRLVCAEVARGTVGSDTKESELVGRIKHYLELHDAVHAKLLPSPSSKMSTAPLSGT